MSTPVVRVGCGCVVVSDDFPGCVLLGKRLGSHGAGKYALPGGHLELGETWEQCLTREVKEETNLTTDNLKLILVTNDPNIDGNLAKHYITIFMRAKLACSSADLVNMEPNKCESWSWVPWSEVVRRRNESPESLFEPMVHLIDGLLAENRSIFD
mmetsp:Transcript_67112/g.132140  ORF Transcript_67112/g.132140 Transcript_67112/m.132140 type:complete len:155 (+) Transcript_67112:60-524(+)